MKIMGTEVPSMYAWTMLLLSALATLESYLYHQIPFNLLVSVTVAAVFDILIKKFYLKKSTNFPYSAIISGLIIGSIAPIDSPIVLGAAAAAVAVLSKFFIRIKNMNLFNPAALGLLISLFLFSQGDQWWAANGYNIAGYIIPFSIVLLISNYKARKLAVSASFLVPSFIIGLVLTAVSNVQITPFIILSSLLQLNFFYAFIMVSEPKTSPFRRTEQIIFGVAVAILAYLFSLYGVMFSLLLSLLLANMGFALWKLYRQKLIQG